MLGHPPACASKGGTSVKSGSNRTCDAMRPSEKYCSSSPQQGRKDCCLTRNGPAEDVASRPLGPWSIWRLVYHLMHWWAGSHNKLQRARVQPQAYKEGNIKGCNLSDQGSRTYTLGPKHTQRQPLWSLFECINVQSGNIWRSAGTTYSTAGDPRGIWGFLNFFEHFLLFLPPFSFFPKKCFFSQREMLSSWCNNCGEGCTLSKLDVQSRKYEKLW